MVNKISVNLNKDVKKYSPVDLSLRIMSKDTANLFFLNFYKGDEAINLDDTHTVEILTKFMNSGTVRLASAEIYQGNVKWDFDTSFITQDEQVYNYVYVRKSGDLVVPPDANTFFFEVGLSEDDKDAVPDPQPQGPSEIDLLMLAIAELDMQREKDRTENQLAIAELAEVLTGGI